MYIRLCAFICVNIRLYAFIYVYVRLYAFTCVYMRLHTFICVYLRLFAFICVYMRLYTFICVYIRLYTLVTLSLYVLQNGRQLFFVQIFVYCIYLIFSYIYLLTSVFLFFLYVAGKENETDINCEFCCGFFVAVYL